MEISYPALTTAALFAALILIDFTKNQYKLLIGHFLIGTIAVLLMIYLSQNHADLAAWGIFLIPLVMLAIGLTIGYLHAAPGSAPIILATQPAKVAKAAVPCDASGNPLANTTVTPSASVACGPGSGQTQCIDTNKLASA